MAKITLKEMLLEGKQLSSNIIVSSVLLDKLEVYGYVNSCRGEDMLTLPKNSYATTRVNGIVNKSPVYEVICSNFIYQVITYYDGKQTTSIGLPSPIYKSLCINSDQVKFNLEDLYIPSLRSNSTYEQIKARLGSGVMVTDGMIRKSGFPENIIAENSKAMFIADEGAILLKNKYGEIRSIGEDVLVVCRYLHPESGTMCYTQFSLDELYVESENDTI